MSEPSYLEPKSATLPRAAGVEPGPIGRKGSNQGLPSWAPWAVLGALMGFGVAGGLGLLPLGIGSKPSAAATADAARPSFTAQAAPSAAPAVPADEQWYSAIYLVVSHKDTKLGATHNITRTREEAKQRAEVALARARKGEDFAKLVQEFSDEPTLARTHGILESFRHKDAVRPFADAVAATQPGEISGIVETQFGFHVIKRREYSSPSPSASAAAPAR